MDFNSKTVAELRSLLTASGVAVPQTYLKKAGLVEMCVLNLRSTSPPASPPARSASRKSSASRRQSSRHSPVIQSEPAESGSPPKRTFSGRPSLSSPAVGRKKISVTPLSTLPPRPRPTISTSVVRQWNHRVTIVIGLLAVGLGAVYLLHSSAPHVPLCNTDGSLPAVNVTCNPCPKLGSCASGKLTACVEHYVVHGDQCVRDEKKFVNAMAIIDSVADHLSSLKGRKECGEEVSDTLYPEQLRVMLRTVFSSLPDAAYRAAFDLALNGEKDGLVVPSYIVTTPLGLLRSQFAQKGFACKVREFMHAWAITILLALLISVVLGTKLLKWRHKRDITKNLIRAIEHNTHYHDGRVQGLSVLDLRDAGMPLHGMEDKDARKTMSLLLKSHSDIQSGEEIHRAGETVYWSAHRLRVEQNVISRPAREAGSESPRKRKLSN